MSTNAFCDSCGAPIESGAEHCTRCGSAVPSPAPPTARSPSRAPGYEELASGSAPSDPPAAQQVTSAVARCPDCGTQIPMRASFCHKCGRPLSAPGPYPPETVPQTGLPASGPPVPLRAPAAPIPGAYVSPSPRPPRAESTGLTSASRAASKVVGTFIGIVFGAAVIAVGAYFALRLVGSGTLAKAMPPLPVIVSQGTSESPTGLTDYAILVWTEVRNDGGDGDVVLEVTLLLPGGPVTKTTSQSFRARETARMSIVFREIEVLDSNVRYQATVSPLTP